MKPIIPCLLALTLALSIGCATAVEPEYELITIHGTRMSYDDPLSAALAQATEFDEENGFGAMLLFEVEEIGDAYIHGTNDAPTDRETLGTVCIGALTPYTLKVEKCYFGSFDKDDKLEATLNGGIFGEYRVVLEGFTYPEVGKKYLAAVVNSDDGYMLAFNNAFEVDGKKAFPLNGGAQSADDKGIKLSELEAQITAYFTSHSADSK